MPYLDQLKKLRDELVTVDQQILELVAKRTAIAEDIGAIKKKWHLPIHDPEQELEVATRNLEFASRLGLVPELASALTTLLVKHAVLRQHACAATFADERYRILIIGGSGKMGTWLKDFLAARGHHISALDLPTTRIAAEDIATVEMIILATPAKVSGGYLDQLLQLNYQGTVFDIASVKAPLINAFQRCVAAKMKILSLHPLFGPKHASLTGLTMLVSPGYDDDDGARSRVLALFAGSGLEFHDVTIENHDHVMLAALNLPHLVNILFARMLHTFDEASLKLAKSSSFKKQLALARSVTQENPDLYLAIQTDHPGSKKLLSQLKENLAAIGKIIAQEDLQHFHSLMESARHLIDHLDQA